MALEIGMAGKAAALGAALLWAVTFGIVFFGEIPSVYTLIGAAIIIGACLVVVQPTATSARTMPDDAGP